MKKRRKSQTALSSEEALSSPPSQLSEEEMEKPAPKIKTKKTSKKSELSSKPAKSKTNHKPNAKASESELSDAPDSPAPAENAPSSDSELSVLIDSEPPPKTNKKQKPLTGAEKRGRKPKTESSDLDPDAAEIKRLQSWLVKCGIRKLWGKELKPYETPKAKIKHLKVMLADAGMTGRYSLEKANQIKEQRELRADIEAVKEGAQRWGKGVDSDNEEDQGGDGRTKPKKRLVRGAQILDFLGSDDGEETD